MIYKIALLPVHNEHIKEGISAKEMIGELCDDNQ